MHIHVHVHVRRANQALISGYQDRLEAVQSALQIATHVTTEVCLPVQGGSKVFEWLFCGLYAGRLRQHIKSSCIKGLELRSPRHHD